MEAMDLMETSGIETVIGQGGQIMMLIPPMPEVPASVTLRGTLLTVQDNAGSPLSEDAVTYDTRKKITDLPEIAVVEVDDTTGDPRRHTWIAPTVM